MYIRYILLVSVYIFYSQCSQYQDNAGNDNLLENLDANLDETATHSLKMPNVVPKKQDTYLCHAYQLPSDDRYIVEFNPAAKQQIAHHMLLYGCKVPGQTENAWECNGMAPICKSGQSIMYAWAKNAPSLKMPKDVGFHVGGKSGIKYLVLQVHYLDVSSFKDGNTDSSGLTFELSSIRPHYFAGIYLLAAGWPPIPAKKEAFHINMGCAYTSKKSLPPTIYPFRFRTHTHSLGVVVTGYRVRDGKWTLIGRGDPQRPQAFYKVSNEVNIREGDKLYGRCTYNAMSRSTKTYFGATHKDEMCNFYIMYFYKQPRHSPNAAARLPCGYTSIKNLDWPTDSDTSLAVMEGRNDEANYHISV